MIGQLITASLIENYAQVLRNAIREPSPLDYEVLVHSTGTMD